MPVQSEKKAIEKLRKRLNPEPVSNRATSEEPDS